MCNSSNVSYSTRTQPNLAPMVVRFIQQDPITATEHIAVKSHSKMDKVNRPVRIKKGLEKWDKQWAASQK